MDTVPPLQPSPQSLDGVTHQAACAARVRVILEHKDNLGRPLPEGTTVELHDYLRGVHTAPIDSEGNSVHPDVPAGQFAWQLLEAPGYHLVAVDGTPLHPVAAGLVAPECVAVVSQTTVVATYLPPPILIDLRRSTDSSGTDTSGADLLSEAQLEQLRLDGNSATLFIHGYEVERGEWSRFSDNAQAAGTNPAPWLVTLRPQGSAAISTLCQHPGDEDDDLNGSGACGWLTNMEYQLNRAAGMTEKDWRPYSRIVAIAWPGDAGKTAFTEAEFRAMQSGRRLVNLLRQLSTAGLTINLISHSLGARVALTALNLLGQYGAKRCIDGLYLWQPAVADNALSPDTPFSERALKGGYDENVGRYAPSRETHPLGMGTFPAAHTLVKHLVVLHSQNDSILGPSERKEDHPDGDSSFIEDSLNQFGGAYPKKWWIVPPILPIQQVIFNVDGLGYFRDFYFERGRKRGSGRWDMAFMAHYQQRADEPYIRHRIDMAWDDIKRAIIQEARDVAAATPPGPLPLDMPLPEYDLLRPLGHHYRISEGLAAAFADRLRQLGQHDNWQPRDIRVRPALGSVGFDKVRNEAFFKQRIDLDIFEPIDQSKWLFAHSAMKNPTEEIFTKSYQDGIIKKMKRSSGFGRY